MYAGGLGQQQEETMLANEVGRLLAETMQDIQAGLSAAQSLGDESLIRVGQTILEDWKLAEKTAINWKNYRSARTTLGYIQTSINNWYSRLRAKGASVQFRGIFTPETGSFFATLKQSASQAVQGAGGLLPSLPTWALAAGAGLVLFLLVRR